MDTRSREPALLQTTTTPATLLIEINGEDSGASIGLGLITGKRDNSRPCHQSFPEYRH